MIAPAAPSPTYTTAQASRHIGLAVSTLEKLRVYGGGPAFVRLGRAVRYLVTDLDAWLSERRFASTAEYV